MKNIVILFYFFLPLFSIAQKNEVTFIKADSWKDILLKAKKEKKYIFLDVFATWCGPCKKMDSEIYNTEKVADYLNSNFIPVKLQIDQTGSDDDHIKKWYPEAEHLVKELKIQTLPSFLFFSQDGEIVQRSEGYKDQQKFLQLLKDASNPMANYAGRIKQYEAKKIHGSKLLRIALEALEYHNDSLAREIAIKYKSTWLDNQEPSKVLTSDLKDFFSAFSSLMKVNDNLIKFMYRHPADADLKLDSKGYSNRLTDFVITKDLINPLIKLDKKYIDKEPDWSAIGKKITESYDTLTSKRLLLNSKLNWYNDKKDWPNIAKYNIERIETQGIDTAGLGRTMINNMVFNVIVKHSDDSEVLNKAIRYMEFILKGNWSSDTWIDTYSCLLYKVGRKYEAIKYEQKAVEIAKKRGDNDEYLMEYNMTLKKMLGDLPLW